MHQTDIDLAVMLLGFACLFALVAGFMYLLLLVTFAYPHHANGYTVGESFNKALKELQ